MPRYVVFTAAVRNKCAIAVGVLRLDFAQYIVRRIIVQVKGIAVYTGTFGDSFDRDFFVRKFAYHLLKYCADCFFCEVDAPIVS